MLRSTRTFVAPLAVLIALFACSLATAAAPRFVKESYPAFQAQLGGGKVTAVTFNKKAHTLHVTVTSGTLFVASYPPADYKSVRAAIIAKGVPVTVEKVKKTGTTKAAAHHKLRYIAAGVLIVVIIVIALVLGFNRRRPVMDGATDEPTAAAAPPPPTAPTDQ